ncbi:MAG: leucyl aminopeptidase family protein [Parcubacteria group bacterium]|jgi:leucyl aminopeptidase
MKIKVIAKDKFQQTKDVTRIAFDPTIEYGRLIFDGKNSILEIKSPEKGKINRRIFIILARQMIFFAKMNRVKKICLDWDDIKSLKLGMTVEDIGEILATNFEMANYEFVSHRTVPKKGWNFVEEVNLVADNKICRAINKCVERGQLIGQEVNVCREWANMPGGEVTPTTLAEEIRGAIKNTGIKMKVLEEKEMEKLGMGAILGVSKGSLEKAKFIILEYGMGLKTKPLVLIGKGITFDSGGLSLKPADSMLEMNMDMSGAAAVVSSLVAAAKLGIKKKVVVLIPAVENMLSGNSYRPGDILKSMSGQTIEVLNTDAEGRIILADALTYAEKYHPGLVIDVATLTGAALIALGERASAIFTKNEQLSKNMIDLGEKSGDYVWPFPMWDEYEAEIKGTTGDIANLKNQGNSRYGGAIIGAMFLYQFAKKFPKWAHIDMAPRQTAVFDEFLSKGAAGAPVRLLIKLIESFK